MLSNVSVNVSVVVVWLESMMIRRNVLSNVSVNVSVNVVSLVVAVARMGLCSLQLYELVLVQVLMRVPKGRIFSRILASSSVFQDPDQTGEV